MLKKIITKYRSYRNREFDLRKENKERKILYSINTGLCLILLSFPYVPSTMENLRQYFRELSEPVDEEEFILPGSRASPAPDRDLIERYKMMQRYYG